MALYSKLQNSIVGAQEIFDLQHPSSQSFIILRNLLPRLYLYSHNPRLCMQQVEKYKPRFLHWPFGISFLPFAFYMHPYTFILSFYLCICTMIYTHLYKDIRATTAIVIIFLNVSVAVCLSVHTLCSIAVYTAECVQTLCTFIVRKNGLRVFMLERSCGICLRIYILIRITCCVTIYSGFKKVKFHPYRGKKAFTP